MRVIIAGTRSLYRTEVVRKAIAESGWTLNEIISGGAQGVDTIGEEIAKEDGIDLVRFPANWKKLNKAAGYKRNEKMAWYANLFNEEGGVIPDKLKGGLIAVWDGQSTGTKNMIEIAERVGLPVFIHIYNKKTT